MGGSISAITGATTLRFTIAGNLKLFAASAAIGNNLTKEGNKMEDFFDDFDDDYDESDFMDEDSFEDACDDDFEMDEQSCDDSDFDGAPETEESQCGDFTAKDAFFIGSAFGFGYEKRTRERKRKKNKIPGDD